MNGLSRKVIAMVTILSFWLTMVPAIAFASEDPMVEGPYRIDSTASSVDIAYDNVVANSDKLAVCAYGGKFITLETFPADSGTLTVDLAATGIDLESTPFLNFCIFKADDTRYAQSNEDSWVSVVDREGKPAVHLKYRVLSNATKLVFEWQNATPGMKLSNGYQRNGSSSSGLTESYTLTTEDGSVELPLKDTLQVGDMIVTKLEDENGEIVASGEYDRVSQSVSVKLEGEGIKVDGIDVLAVGDAFIVKLTPPKGKALDKLLVNDTDMSDKVKNNELSISATETEYTIKVSWKEDGNLQPPAQTEILTLEGEGISATPATGHKAGDSVVITLTTPNGKVLNELLFNNMNVANLVKDNKVTVKLVDKNVVKVTWKDASANEKPPVAPTGKKEAVTVLVIGANKMVMTVDGVSKEILLDSPPYINPGQNRTMLPLRAVGEILGMKVDWDDKTRTVSVKGDGINALIPVDASIIVVNGVTKKVDAAAEIKNSRTMMSISNLGVALGLERDKHIFWDAATRTVTLKTLIPDKQPVPVNLATPSK